MIPPRAFTLLETMLAALIGSIFVLAALSIMLMIQRSDRTLGDRYDQMHDLYAVRLVLDRAFNHLLMSEAPAPSPPQGSGMKPREWIFSLRETDPDSLGPERIMLDTDPRLSGFAVERRNESAAGLTALPQRLEVVLTDSPVPSQRAEIVGRIAEYNAARAVEGRRRSSDAARGVREGSGRPGAGKDAGAADRTDTPDAGGGDEHPDDRPPASRGDDSRRGARPPGTMPPIPSEPSPLDLTLRSVRGAFELHPDPDAPLDDAGRPRSWELWWVPLPRVGSSWDEAEGGVPLDPPFRVASHIRYLHWRAFRDRGWLDAVHATVPQELPAYIEAEIETTAGLSDRWLFEVTYAFGPELPRHADDDGGAASGSSDDRRVKPGTPGAPGGEGRKP